MRMTAPSQCQLARAGHASHSFQGPRSPAPWALPRVRVLTAHSSRNSDAVSNRTASGDDMHGATTVPAQLNAAGSVHDNGGEVPLLAGRRAVLLGGGQHTALYLNRVQRFP